MLIIIIFENLIEWEAAILQKEYILLDIGI